MTIVDPDRTYVEAECRIGRDCVLEPGVMVTGKTRIGRGVTLQAGCVVQDSVLEDGVVVKPYSVIESSKVRKGAIVGPFAHLRPQSDIGEGVCIGNFVEVKKSRVGKGSKAGHLSYLGDAVVGKNVNVGAGTITCNYDGMSLHPTILGDGVFVGSDTMLVAPVTVGKGALIGAGSTITRDVPPFALALSRAEQKVSEYWVVRRRPELLEEMRNSRPLDHEEGRETGKMCGIVGYTGPNPCVEILVDGLRRLEYRGYDSAGIAVLADGGISDPEVPGQDRPPHRADREGADLRNLRDRPHPVGDPRPPVRRERASRTAWGTWRSSTTGSSRTTAR